MGGEVYEAVEKNQVPFQLPEVDSVSAFIFPLRGSEGSEESRGFVVRDFIFSVSLGCNPRFPDIFRGDR